MVFKKKKSKSPIRDIGVDVASKPAKSCADSACPWHGGLKVRGRTFRGDVVAAKAAKTVIIEWSYLKKIGKFQRYMRKTSRIAAHNPPCIGVGVGDVVRIAECRPLSKTKHFVVIEKVK